MDTIGSNMFEHVRTEPSTPCFFDIGSAEVPTSVDVFQFHSVEILAVCKERIISSGTELLYIIPLFIYKYIYIYTTINQQLCVALPWYNIGFVVLSSWLRGRSCYGEGRAS